MSKFILFINLVLSSVVFAWIGIAYFEYKKQSYKNTVIPGIDITYLPVSLSFMAEQVGMQFNTSYYANADKKIPSKLIYLSSPPVSELSDSLLHPNLTTAVSKIAIENLKIPFRATDLFSPIATPIEPPFIRKAQSLTKTRSTNFSMNIDPPILIRLTNFDPKKMLSSKIPAPIRLNTRAPVTPIAEFSQNKLTKMEPTNGLMSFERPIFERIESQKLTSHLQSPQVTSRPFVASVEDRAEMQIKKYKRMLSLTYRSMQKPEDEQLSFHNETVANERYVVAIGVFAQPSNLDKNINKILSNNLPVTVANLVPGNPRLRQLASGPFIHKTEALEVLNSIKALGYSDAYIQKANQ